MYVCNRNLYRTKVLWVLKFRDVGDLTNSNQNRNLAGYFLKTC